jgi:hypothetical protein
MFSSERSNVLAAVREMGGQIFKLGFCLRQIGFDGGEAGLLK